MTNDIQLTIASLLYDIYKFSFKLEDNEFYTNILRNYEKLVPGINTLLSLEYPYDYYKLYENENYLELKKIIIADLLASPEMIAKKKVRVTKYDMLFPIFTDISLFKTDYSKKFNYLGRKLSLMEGSSEIFPQPEEIVNTSIEKNTNDTWNSYKKSFERIEEYQNEPDKTIQYLYSLLKKFFKFLPSETYSEKCDVSLFDHSRMVCALTVSLKNYFKSNKIDKTQKIIYLNKIGKNLLNLNSNNQKNESNIKIDELNKEIFTLIHGDFSGIQNFIHLISSKHAMKTLKGRSFFFSILTENFAYYLVKKLNLYKSNIIFAGGGHFYIISHNYKEIENDLKECSIKINDLFVKYFNSNLYLALDFIPLTIETLLFHVSEAWKSVNIRTSVKKRKKFDELIQNPNMNYFSDIFGPDEYSSERIERCVVCNSYTDLELIDDESEDKWCSQCKSFKELTEQLKTSHFFRIIPSSNKNYNLIFNEFNNAIDFKEIITNRKYEWFSINSPSISETLGDIMLPIAFPLDMYGNIINLTELALRAEENTGFNKIGILKMDVDSLGKIFQTGLGKSNTISRVSTLSTSLSLFFDGYIAKLIQSKSEFNTSIYLIFSGGDDLFAVGRWDKIIDFSFQLYRDFRKFTCFNPDITLSAGIIIENPNFPIIKASQAAENELNNAKNYEPFTDQKNTKNKISIFGLVLNWDWTLEKDQEYMKIFEEGQSEEQYHRELLLDIMRKTDTTKIDEEIEKWLKNKSEFDLALIIKDILVYLIEKKGFSKSLLHKMENSAIRMRRVFIDSLEGKISVPKLWRLKYYLRSVLSSKDKKVKLLSDFIIRMFEIIVRNNFFNPNSNLHIKNVEFISVAVKWADYSTR